MRITLAAVAALALASSASAQEPTLPAGLTSVELERSRECVAIFAGLRVLDQELAPVAARAQRLMAIGQAVALEDERVLDQLDASDSIEAQVQTWFEQDQQLAQRYVATLAEQLTSQRATAKEAIRAVLTDALSGVQAQAEEKITASGNLPARAGPCDGAIFVRSAVLEACAESSGPICDEAALPASEVKQFRFVDDPAAVWDVTELRPWTAPTPLRVSQQGQLEGARTIGYARVGNVVVSVSFSPLIRDRAEMSPEELSAFQSTNEALGLTFDHPDVTFTPAIALRATLPQPLDGEASYALHLGDPEEPEVLWSAPAGSGRPIEASVRLTAEQVTRLRAGDPVSLTALGDGTPTGEPLFTIELSDVNQARAVEALLSYMQQQLGADLTAILAPRERG